MRRLFFLAALGIIGCTNPSTPAGYVGYVTKHPYTMPVRFYEIQTEPTSTGLGWRLEATNIMVTPITSTEEFTGTNAVLAKDNLHIEFRAHLIWKIEPENVRALVEKFSGIGAYPEQMAYSNFVKEPFRTYTRDEVQKYNGLDVKDNIDAIGSAVQARILKLAQGTPFTIISVVIGNIQYPRAVAECEGADSGSGCRRNSQSDGDHQPEADSAVCAVRGDSGAGEDGQFTQPYGGVHSGRSDGRAGSRHAEDGTGGQTIAGARRWAPLVSSRLICPDLPCRLDLHRSRDTEWRN